MRIIFIGPGYRFKHRYFYYSFYKMLLAGFQRTASNVFFMSDRDTADSFALGIRALGKPYANRYLLDTCEKFEPDLIVSCHADIITLETLEAIKARSNTKICLVDCDYVDPQGQGGSIRRLRRLHSVLDAAFFTTGGGRLRATRELFKHAYYVPNPLDEGTFSVDHDAPRPHDLGYIASSLGRVQHLLDAAGQAGLTVKTGGGKKQAALYGLAFERQLQACKSGLIASLYDEDLYSSDRIAQVFGTGCAALVPSTLGLQKYIPDDAAIYYEDAPDMVAKLSATLADDSYRAIASRGREAYLEAFGSQKVAQYIIDKAMDPTQNLHSFDLD